MHVCKLPYLTQRLYFYFFCFKNGNLYCLIPNRAVICISQFKMPSFLHFTVLTHFQEPKKLLFWKFQGRIHSLHLKFCMPCLGCNHQVISGTWLDYYYIIKLDAQVPERPRVVTVNMESQVPDRWRRAAWTGGGWKDRQEGPRKVQGTWGSHLPVVTPTSWCHWTIGWVSHTCGAQARPRTLLNLDSPAGQCREEAGLQSLERCWRSELTW